jgi:hypothetical protein
MLEPGLYKECLDEPAFFRGILDQLVGQLVRA